jgi:hypothetical protein
MWRTRSQGPHLATAIGVVLTILGLGTAFGMHLSAPPTARPTAAELAR